MTRKITALFIGIIAAATAAAESAPPPEKERSQPSDEMRALFRENPEAFRKVMRERAEKQRSLDTEFWKAVDELGKKYRESSDPAEKEALKKEITARVAGDYAKHLKRSRERLDDLKKRVTVLEEEQRKREEAAPQAVEFRVGHVLAGTKPPPPQPERRQRGGERRGESK